MWYHNNCDLTCLNESGLQACKNNNMKSKTAPELRRDLTFYEFIVWGYKAMKLDEERSHLPRYSKNRNLQQAINTAAPSHATPFEHSTMFEMLKNQGCLILTWAERVYMPARMARSIRDWKNRKQR